jgi:hypothetical protein
MRLKTVLASGAFMAGVLANPAYAVELELGLGIDGSGSISPSDFNLQRTAYANVLSNASVLPLDGSVAIGVKLFASSVVTIFPVTTITSANIADLISAINAMTRPTGSTNIAGTITAFSNEFFSNGIDSARQVIDISTDGDNNVGNLATAKANALAAGVDQINCVGIGVGANCTPVVGGVGAFSVVATDFAGFDKSLENKIRTEVGTSTVPEPATWLSMIVGFGLAGATLRRRRVAVSFAV